jgi:hypothetical protein
VVEDLVKAPVGSVRDYRVWRCRAPENPVRVGGSKWDREAAAFTKLFRSAGVLPLPVDMSRAEDRAADSVSARVSWLTPQTWVLWTDAGSRGGCPIRSISDGRADHVLLLNLPSRPAVTRHPRNLSLPAPGSTDHHCFQATQILHQNFYQCCPSHQARTRKSPCTAGHP